VSGTASLPSARRQIVLIVGTFAVVGVAFGTVGYVTADWAQTQFVTAATGTAPETFGPVFLALSVFQTTVTLLFTGPVLAATVGLLSGSRFADVGTAGLVAASGTLLGFFVMASGGLAGLSLLSGPGTEQTYPIAAAVGPLLLSSVATTVTGGLAGVLGSWFVR
jgi:hypothetical protein